MFTRDRIQMDLSDRIGLLFTRDRSGTDPERIQMDPKMDLLFCRFSFGSVWIPSGPVPEQSRVSIASHTSKQLKRRRKLSPFDHILIAFIKQVFK